MKTVRVTVDVVVRDEETLEKRVREFLVHKGTLPAVEEEIMDEVLGRYSDRVAGLVAEVLAEVLVRDAPPMDYGIEIRSIAGEAL
jgi:hypothetical protein